MLFLIHSGEVSRRKRLAGAVGVEIEAHRALVERLDHDIAIGIEDFPETPVINHTAGWIHFGDHVANRADIAAVGTTNIVGCDAQKEVTVLGLIKGVRKVFVAGGETAVEDFAAHDVVLHVALTIAPGERTVVALLEAHHDAAVVDRFHVID